jgi:hypothetical protein
MGINMHATVRGAITSVNNDIAASFQASTGNTPNASGKQTPTFATAVPVKIQSQPLKYSDLQHINNMNLTGVFRSVHMYGNTEGVVRPTQQGGDLLTFKQTPSSVTQTWKVVSVMETWPEWCRVLVCLQA